MERVLPWQVLIDPITSYSPEGKRGRPPFLVEKVLRIHLLQQWLMPSDPSMKEALQDVPLFRDFASSNGNERLLDEMTLLRCRRLLEEHEPAPQIATRR